MSPTRKIPLPTFQEAAQTSKPNPQVTGTENPLFDQTVQLKSPFGETAKVEPVNPTPPSATVEPPEAKKPWLMSRGFLGSEDSSGDAAAVEEKPRRRGRARTTISDSPTESEPVDLPKVVIGLLGLAFVGIAFAYGRSTKREFRKPTTREKRAIAAPLARIAARHDASGLLGPDAGDLLEAGVAVSEYLGAGPLSTGPLSYDPGVPADIQEIQEG